MESQTQTEKQAYCYALFVESGSGSGSHVVNNGIIETDAKTGIDFKTFFKKSFLSILLLFISYEWGR